MHLKKNKYLLGALITIGVLIGNQIIIQFFLQKNTQDSKTINLAGRQRMLSQKLNLQYLQRLSGDTVNNTLLKTLNNWQKVHYALINGDSKLNIKPIENNKALLILANQTPKIILAGQIVLQKPTLNQNKILSKNQAQFLIAMDNVVNYLEDAANKKLLFIIYLEIFLCLLTVTLIVLEFYLFYKPFLREQKLTLKKSESSESKLKAILNSTTDSNIFISPDFKVINFNNAAQQSIKVFYGKEIVFEQDFKEFIIPGTEDIFYEEFANCLKGEIISSEYNFKKHGFDIWFCNTYFPVYNNLNQLIGVTFNSTNIDTRKKAEIKIEEQLCKLKDIAWQQSHLIRSPVVNILGLTKLLGDKLNLLNDDENEVYTKLIQEVERLDVIITDIVQKATNSQIGN